MAKSGPEFEASFLRQLQLLLTEGSFVSTYKFALLLSLVRWALEHPDHDHTVPVHARELAPYVVEIYWHHVEPFSGSTSPEAEGSGTTGAMHLLQERGGQPLAILAKVGSARRKLGGQLSHELQAAHDAGRELLGRVTEVLVQMPLWKLQALPGADRSDGFLYRRVPRSPSRFFFQPGVVRCLVSFASLIEDHVRAAWVRFVLRCNSGLLGVATELESFLFPRARRSLDRWREPLIEVTRRVCFYCNGGIRAGSEVVDHFLPWSRYPRDLGHNFVLAHAPCNGAKKDHLAAEFHLEKWCNRNKEHGASLRRAFDDLRLPHDEVVTQRVAGSLYSGAAEVGQRVWLEGRRLVALSAKWAPMLASWQPSR